MVTEMALETELETYQRLLPTLLEERGKFAVIHGKDLVGTFNDYEDALQAGYEHCGLKPFLVKKIEETESVHQFSRDIA